MCCLALSRPARRSVATRGDGEERQGAAGELDGVGDDSPGAGIGGVEFDRPGAVGGEPERQRLPPRVDEQGAFADRDGDRACVAVPAARV